MLITKLSTQKKDNGRFNLEIDGEFVCSISSSTLALYNLYKGKSLDEETLNEVVNKEIENRFFDRAVGIATASPKTEKQVEIYLQQLAFKKKGIWYKEEIDIKPIISNVLTRLLKYNFVDDRNYARLFVESRMKNRPRGKQVLVSELISKGVEEKLAKEVVNELVVDTDSLIKKAFEKRFRTNKIDLKNRKQVDFLLRKGFDWDSISKFGRDRNDTGE